MDQPLTWNAQANWLLAEAAIVLSAKELDFVTDMSEQDYLPSKKQLDWLDRIFQYWWNVVNRMKK